MELTDTQRKQMGEYILMMLGAPVVKIELDKEQVELAIDQSLRHVDSYYVDKTIEVDKQKERALLLVHEGAYILAKLMLGRIRSKFVSPPGPGGSIKLDGPALVKEANQEFKNWKNRLTD